MVDCKETKLRFRADQLFFSPVTIDDEEGEVVGYVCVQENTDEQMVKDAKKQAKALLKSLDRKGQKIQAFSFKEVNDEDYEKTKEQVEGILKLNRISTSPSIDADINRI